MGTVRSRFFASNVSRTHLCPVGRRERLRCGPLWWRRRRPASVTTHSSSPMSSTASTVASGDPTQSIAKLIASFSAISTRAMMSDPRSAERPFGRGRRLSIQHVPPGEGLLLREGRADDEPRHLANVLIRRINGARHLRDRVHEPLHLSLVVGLNEKLYAPDLSHTYIIPRACRSAVRARRVAFDLPRREPCGDLVAVAREVRSAPERAPPEHGHLSRCQIY